MQIAAKEVNVHVSPGKMSNSRFGHQMQTKNTAYSIADGYMVQKPPHEPHWEKKQAATQPPNHKRL
jgi:hypothetical protein